MIAMHHKDKRSRYLNDAFYKSFVDFLCTMLRGHLINKVVILECLELAEEINRERKLEEES